jgi:hypothetical protein
MNVRGVLSDLRTMAAMPRVRIVLSRGRPHEDAVLRNFRRRHPRYKLVRFKSIGVALLPLDEVGDVDAYLATHRTTRKRVRRAERLGYTTGVFEPDERRDELLAIHASIPERQGRPIDAEYLDPDAAYTTAPYIEYLGVFAGDRLVAYSMLYYVGDVVAMFRVMGHGDHLDDGVMFLLGAGIVAHVKATHPETRYVFYDMFFGAGEGLRSFKARLGFQPHYVRWKRVAA